MSQEDVFNAALRLVRHRGSRTGSRKGKETSFVTATKVSLWPLWNVLRRGMLKFKTICNVK